MSFLIIFGLSCSFGAMLSFFGYQNACFLLKKEVQRPTPTQPKIMQPFHACHKTETGDPSTRKMGYEKKSMTQGKVSEDVCDSDGKTWANHWRGFQNLSRLMVVARGSWYALVPFSKESLLITFTYSLQLLLAREMYPTYTPQQ